MLALIPSMDKILKISASASLAMYAMVHVDRSRPGKIHSVAKIAAAKRESKSLWSKVLQRLMKVGLLASRRGPGGGFFIGQKVKHIRLIEILEAIGGLSVIHTSSVNMCKEPACLATQHA
jgi:Rrf2 family protein